MCAIKFRNNDLVLIKAEINLENYVQHVVHGVCVYAYMERERERDFKCL